MLLASFFKGAQRVWFKPAMFERQSLGNKFRVDQSARSGLDGERGLAGWRPLFFDTLPHARDLLLPTERIGCQASPNGLNCRFLRGAFRGWRFSRYHSSRCLNWKPSCHIRRAEVGQRASESSEPLAEVEIAGNWASPRQGLNFPKLTPSSIIFLVRSQCVYEQSFFAVGSQPSIRDKRDPHLRMTGEQFHKVSGQALQFWNISRGVISDEQDIQVRSIGEFLSSEFSQANDHNGC